MKTFLIVIASIIMVLSGLFCAYMAMTIFCLILAFIMQFLFPAFMKVVAINWPEWVIVHSGNFSSWFIFFLTIKLLIGTFIPISPGIKKSAEEAVNQNEKAGH